MSKRNTQLRRRQILDRLNALGEVSVELLAAEFETSEVTIRKDLTALEADGLLLRRYGGAVPMPQELINTSIDAPSPTKLAIAKAAAKLIKDHNRIVLDSGSSTTAALLPELSTKQGLVVMTNSLNIANALRELENEPTILMTGGTWDPKSEGFQGQLAEQMLRSYNFDQFFIGADGLDLERGTTTFNELFSLSRVMAEVAREVIVLAESEKVARKIPNLELAWSQITTLVTDKQLSDSAKKQIEQQGVHVICAESF
ncbi:MAG: DeoR/GlpR family DNA-binding transcription regulator [Cellvibrio sp.]